jgi:hypothetical protein
MLRFTLALLMLTVCCSAGSITYDLDLTIGFGGVAGDIVTDGTIGVLTGANIVSWDLTLNDGTDPAVTLTGTNSSVSVAPDDQDLSATASQLLFNFNDTGPDPSYFRFLSTDVLSGVCWSIAPVDCVTPGNTATGLSLLVGGNVGNAQFTSGTVIGSNPGTTPEPSTLALLGLGIAALGFRKFRASRSFKLTNIPVR